MTRAQAKRRVCRILSAEILHHEGNGSEWLWLGDNEEELDEEDRRRMVTALHEVADELGRRGRRRLRP